MSDDFENIPQDFGDREVGYFEGKIAEFQKALNDVDAARANLESLLVLDITDEQVLQIQGLITEYYEKQQDYIAIANLYNDITGVASSVGFELPSIQIPSGLGFFPALAVPAAWAIVVAGAAAIIAFTYSWINRASAVASTIAEQARLTAQSITNPELRDKALNDLAHAQQAASEIAGRQTGFFGSIGDSLKWILIGGAALLVLS